MQDDLSQQRCPIRPRESPGNVPSAILFITVASKHRKEVLASDIFQCLLETAWSEYDQWLVGRYLIMPDHVHFFCTPKYVRARRLCDWMTCWKRAVSREWKAGSGSLWDRDYHDTSIRSNDDYAASLARLLSNPHRRNLVARAEDWPFQGEIHVLPAPGIPASPA